MPIRLPKGFARRRSSGNALEEVPLPNPPEPSFKVFARRPSASKSFDGGNSAQYVADGRPKSAGHYLESFPSENERYSQHLNNRGSGGTNNSSSSGGLFDASSSARYSSTSTLPSTSSNEGMYDDYSHAHPKPVYGLPQSSSQPSFSRRPKGRTFSFGKKLVQQQKQPASPEERQPQISSVPPIRDVPAIPRPLSRTWVVEDTGGMYSRPRAMTDQSYASESTAKPPVLPVASLDLQGSDGVSDFGNIFQDYDSPRYHIAPISAVSSQTFEHLVQEDQPPKVPPKSTSFSARLPYTPPPPLSVNYARAITPSPYSHDSQDSRDGLLYNQSPGINSKSLPHPPEASLQRPRSIVETRVSLQSSTSSSNSPTRDRPSNMRRTSVYSMKRASTPLHDIDAMLVMDSINAAKSLNRQSVTFDDSPQLITSRKSLPVEQRSPEKLAPYTHYNHAGPESLGGKYSPVNMYDEPEHDDTIASNTWHNESLDSTPRAQKTELSQPGTQSESQPEPQPEDSDLLFDPTFQEMAKSAEQIETGRLSPPPEPTRQIGKVMTPAQYERYRKEKEMSSARSTSSKDDSDNEDDHYDDEDEVERSREVVKQRRKQEAHLAVYRQQMMKVTGEQPKPFNTKRPGMDASYSTPDLSAMNLKTGNGGKNSDDEDDDVPLGILAAHGFPSKDRQPGQLDRTSSTPVIRYQSETYPPPSVAGGSVVGGPSGSLPPFARNLPKDPYFGASLVSPSNREAAGFGNNGGGSVYGGSQIGSPHPAGLVGVIASEEKARALRRGSPNAQAGWGGNLFPQGMSPMGTSLSPGDQAQIQMSQQMQQMMQMQMQWMQQMMAMQQGQQTLAPPQVPFMQGQMPQMPPNGLSSPQNPNMLRPMSMGSNAMASPQAQQQQRAMSMLSPNMSQKWGQQPNRSTEAPSMMSGALGGPGYAPSITPSERSNIGQPSRYRPVSVTPNEKSSRSNTLSSQNALQGWNSGKSSGVQTTLKALNGNAKGKQIAGKGSDDEDDDAGWKELKASREKKKSSWRLKRKDDNGLGDLYYGS